MRDDPNRIPVILSLLSEVWKLQPDLTLGELIADLLPDSSDPMDMFNLSDDELEKRLRLKWNALNWHPYRPENE